MSQPKKEQTQKEYSVHKQALYSFCVCLMVGQFLKLFQEPRLQKIIGEMMVDRYVKKDLLATEPPQQKSSTLHKLDIRHKICYALRHKVSHFQRFSKNKEKHCLLAPVVTCKNK